MTKHSSKFDLRLAAYGVAAATAAATEAQAGVIYTPGPQTTPVNGSVFLLFHPTNGQIGQGFNAQAQFEILHSEDSTTTTSGALSFFTSAIFRSASGVAGPGGLLANRFGLNQSIGSALAFTGQVLAVRTSNGSRGLWSGQRGFAGLRFTFNGNTHYAWADISVDSQRLQATVHCIAFEDTPNAPIRTPSTFSHNCADTSSDVPEPSSLALMALGSAGLLAWRRKKQAA